MNLDVDCGSPVIASRSFRPVTPGFHLDSTTGSGVLLLGFHARGIACAPRAEKTSYFTFSLSPCRNRSRTRSRNSRGATTFT